MANNFRYGKDFTTPGFPALANHYFVSKDGDDLNAGTDPDLPKLTIQSALTACPDNGTIVVGPGMYDEFDLVDVGTGKTLQGDGLVYLEREFENLILTGTDLAIENFTIGQYDSFGINSGAIRNSTVRIKTVDEAIDPLASVLVENNVYENVTFNLAANASPPADIIVDKCIFINCVINYGNNAITAIKNSHFSSTCLLNLDQISDSDQFTFNNINCGVTMNSVLYNSLEAAQEFGSFVECVDKNAAFVGEAVGNYALSSSSELFGLGESGINITGRSLGFGFNSQSPEVITGSGDVTFNEAGEWIAAGDSATWTTAPIDLFKVRPLGPIDLVGLVDYINNVPDFDNKAVNTDSPNILDLELRWANTLDDLDVATYQSFRWNEQPTFDGALYNGAAGFNWSTQQSISARYIQTKVIIRNNYVA